MTYQPVVFAKNKKTERLTVRIARCDSVNVGAGGVSAYKIFFEIYGGSSKTQPSITEEKVS